MLRGLRRDLDCPCGMQDEGQRVGLRDASVESGRHAKTYRFPGLNSMCRSKDGTVGSWTRPWRGDREASRGGRPHLVSLEDVAV